MILLSAKKQTNTKKKTAQKRSASRAKAPAPKQRRGLSPRIKSILYIALAILFLVLIFVPGSNFWTMIRSFFFGIFGLGMLLVPPFFVYLCVINEKEKQVAHFGAKIALCVMIFLIAGATIFAFNWGRYQNMNYFAALGNLYLDGYNSAIYIPLSCGLIGGILGYPVAALCGQPVAIILTILLLAVIIFIITNLSVKDVAKAATRATERIRRANEERAARRRERMEEEQRLEYGDNYSQPKPKKLRRQKQQPVNNSDIDVPIYMDGKRQNASPAPSSDIDIPLDDTKRRRKRKKDVAVPKNNIDIDYTEPDEQNAVDLDNSEDLINIIKRASKPMGEEGETTVEDIAGDITAEKRANRISLGAKQADPETVPVEVVRKKRKPADEQYSEFDNIGYNPDNSLEEIKPEKVYHYPPIQLLKPNNSNNDKSAMEELQHNSKKLIETLNSFGVNATIINICRGPSVTRYELQPAPGVKISKITNLSDDIALNLAANGVRIEAPIPGKAAVGIEVPNKVVSMVSMRELIDSDKFRNSKSKLTAVLGRDISGEIVVTDISKMPHLLIAGTTGSGKSVCVNSILISILYKSTPDEVKMLLIDPKMVEFSKYKGIPHLLIPIVSDAKKAAAALGWAVNEMLQRYKIFSEFDCKEIDSYNALVEKNLEYIKNNPPVENEDGELVQPTLEVNGLPVAKEKMSRVIIAIDELADLMMAAPSEVEDSICRLAQMARAAGMHLILATQRPTVNVITGLIKANVPSRIALRVSSNMDSRTILDTGGAEKLIGRGDMLFSPVGAPKPMRVQGCYASDEEIDGVTNYIKKSSKAEYNAEIEESIKRIEVDQIATGKKAGSSDDGGESSDYDAKIDEAIQCVIEAGQASTSLVQRRLKVGYARAGRIIDEMEQLGVVGPHQGSKPRDVLMTYNEWLERRNVLQNHGSEDE